MIKTQIEDGTGTGKCTKVLAEGELLVSHATCPPLEPQLCKVFSQF